VTGLRRLTASSAIGWLLVALAATVAASWIGRYAPVLHGIPGAVMVISTALCHGLLGLALALAGLTAQQRTRQLQTLLGGAVALIGVVVLFAHLTDLGVIVDWPELHAWADPDEPGAGRMSIPTASIFVLAGAVLVLMHRVRETWHGLLVQGLTSLVVAMGVIGMLGWSLRLRLVYENYLLGGMSLLTAFGFLLVGAGLWSDWRHLDWYRLRTLIVDQGLRITLNAIALLATMLGVALAAGFGIVAHQLDSSARQQLLEPLKRRVDQFRSIVDLRLAQAAMIAAGPEHAALLRVLNTRPADERALALLRAAAESVLPHGFSGIAFVAAGGAKAEAGRFVARPEIELALGERPATLLWDEGFVLRARVPVTQGGAVAGSLLTEQRLHPLTTALEYAHDFAASGDVGVCGRRGSDLQCFPRRSEARPVSSPYAPALPMARALRGETGVSVLRDSRGANVMAAYGPIGNLGLGLVVQMDTTEIYATLRQELYLVVALLAAMVLLGALLFYGRVAPLARTLFLQEQRLKLALDCSRSAVWDLDLTNGIVYLSEQWPTLLGQKPRTSSVKLEDLYLLVHPDDVAQVRRSVRATLRGDGLPYDIEHRVRTPAGDWTWIHSVGEVVERDRHGKALRVIGVNTNIARRKQAESFIERRASRDEATGLPNRAVFTDRLQSAMARARRAPPDRSLMAVFFLRVHEFSDVDETLGKAAGTALLKEVAERVQGCIRATDTVARMAVDEFAVILEELGLTEQACHIAAKIIAALRPGISVERVSIAASSNIGIAFYDGVIKVTAEELVAKAQNAMYDARSEAPNAFRVAPT